MKFTIKPPEAEIISLSDRFPERIPPTFPASLPPGAFPVEPGPPPTTSCFHYRALVNRLARTVVCGNCGVALDPIDQLDAIARDAGWVKHMRAEKNRLHEEIAALKKQLANAKQAAKRARGKGSP